MVIRGAIFGILAVAALTAGQRDPWNGLDLKTPPETFEAPHQDEPGVKSLWFAGPPYKGKPTRIFAYYGEPSGRAGNKVPAMVLIHGGGGTAFAEWVRMWNARGY